MGDSYGGPSNGYAPDAPSNLAGSLQSKNKGSVASPERPHDGKPGNLMGVPWRLALALQNDGWILRDAIIWAKKSPMPESLAGWRWEQCRVKVASAWTDENVHPSKLDGGQGGLNQALNNNPNQATWTGCPGCPKCESEDGLVLRRGSWRTTSAHEYIYMLTKGMGYYADGEAVKTEALSQVVKAPDGWDTGPGAHGTIHRGGRQKGQPTAAIVTGANRRSVWSDISREPYGGAHFATFPSDLPRICIQASTSEKGVCSECGSQWARVVGETSHTGRTYARGEMDADWRAPGSPQHTGSGSGALSVSQETTGWRATCRCNVDVIPATVLDPFAGTFTTGVAAQKLGRRAVGTDISEAYLAQAVKRLSGVALPFNFGEVI
jgi:hypothetical protein